MNKISRRVRLLLKVLYTKKYSCRTDLVGDREYNEKLFSLVFGKKPEIECPKTFNEHIISRKVLRDEYDLAAYTDKYEVRSFVRERLGEEFLNPVYEVFSSPDEIKTAALPDSFALKGNHGSGYNIIVPDKKSFDADDAVKKFTHWLGENYYYLSREKNYKNIVPKILCEKYIESSPDEPINELKFWCFDGRARVIIDTRVIGSQRHATLYNESLERLPVTIGYPAHNFPLQKNIKNMIEYSQKLAKGFDFVRVDMYNVGTKPFFSELTFHPSGGFVPFEPPEWDEKFGSLFDELCSSGKSSPSAAHGELK